MMRLPYTAALALLVLSPLARAQTDPRIVTAPWPTAERWGETHDDLLYEAQAHMKDQPDADAQIFWWDSTGRFRFNTADARSPTLGYRYLTINFDTNSRVLPDTLDEVSLAAAMPVGEVGGGDLSVLIGAGYSGDNLFADSEGVFGIAHLLWRKRLGETDALVLSLDYNGVSALYPDVPLPGAEFVRHDGPLWFELGFPRNSVTWSSPDSPFSFAAAYAVPYTADVVADYRLGGGVSAFARYANFYNAFRLDGEPQTHRLFFQMSRAEIGIRYVNPHLVFDWAYVDASLSIGYAFEQHVSEGFDVRETHPLDEVSDVPYVGLVIRGWF